MITEYASGKAASTEDDNYYLPYRSAAGVLVLYLAWAYTCYRSGLDSKLMPRFNISLPDHLVEQWESLENRSQWVQDKLEEEYKEKKEEENGEGNTST